MIEHDTLTKLKKFKNTNRGDVLGVIRTFYPNVKIDTIFTQRKSK